MTSEIKIYRIKGSYIKKHQKFTFVKEMRAMKKEDALERIYCEIGSQRVLRRRIRIEEIKELSPNEVKSNFINQLNNF